MACSTHHHRSIAFHFSPSPQHRHQRPIAAACTVAAQTQHRPAAAAPAPRQQRHAKHTVQQRLKASTVAHDDSTWIWMMVRRECMKTARGRRAKHAAGGPKAAKHGCCKKAGNNLVGCDKQCTVRLTVSAAVNAAARFTNDSVAPLAAAQLRTSTGPGNQNGSVSVNDDTTRARSSRYAARATRRECMLRHSR